MKEYWVKKINTDLALSASGEDPNWQRANILNDFCYPWEYVDSQRIVDANTQFRALHNGDKLYFLFRVNDPMIDKRRIFLSEQAVIDIDRVELFFRVDAQMQPYYALEIDPFARVLDTRGNYRQAMPRSIQYDWSWPASGLDLISSIDPYGYSVEGAISFDTLRTLNLYRDEHSLEVGIFRAHYQDDEQHNYSPHWVSWVVPRSSTPDFHIPSAFGLLHLEPKVY